MLTKLNRFRIFRWFNG